MSKASPQSNSYVGNSTVLAAIMEASNDIIYLLNAQTGAPVYANRSLLQSLNYSPKQIDAFGDEWPKSIVHQDDLPYLKQHILGLADLAPGARSRVVYRVKDPEENWHCVEMRGLVLESADGGLVLGVSRLLDHNAEDSIHEGKHHDHRCTNCNKLLGRTKPEQESVEIKCSRCGEYNHLEVA